MNGKRVRRVMRELGLAAEPPPRRVRTTDSNHAFPRHHNLVADLVVTHPDAVLLDVFTRRIRGWHLDRSLEGSLTLTALNRALRRGTPAIHHSDSVAGWR